MYSLTDEQKAAFQKHIAELYPDDSLHELNSDPSLQSWWAAIADDIRAKMLEIDRDQMRSASSLPTLWAR